MRGEGTFENEFFLFVRVGSDLVGQLAHGLPDAFDHAGAHDRMVVHVEQLILARRGACVDDQNFHGFYQLMK